MKRRRIWEYFWQGRLKNTSILSDFRLFWRIRDSQQKSQSKFLFLIFVVICRPTQIIFNEDSSSSLYRTHKNTSENDTILMSLFRFDDLRKKFLSKVVIHLKRPFTKKNHNILIILLRFKINKKISLNQLYTKRDCFITHFIKNKTCRHHFLRFPLRFFRFFYYLDFSQIFFLKWWGLWFLILRQF